MNDDSVASNRATKRLLFSVVSNQLAHEIQPVIGDIFGFVPEERLVTLIRVPAISQPSDWEETSCYL